MCARLRDIYFTLSQREDTIRCIVTSFTTDDAQHSELFEEFRRGKNRLDKNDDYDGDDGDGEEGGDEDEADDEDAAGKPGMWSMIVFNLCNYRLSCVIAG